MRTLVLFIGSGFGSGYSPMAPGTVGSLLAVMLIYPVIIHFGLAGIIVFTVVCSFLTLLVSNTCEEEWGEDPGKLVMDEFAGQALVFVTIPFTGVLEQDILFLTAGFFLFRLFDIWKPLGINRAQKLHGGAGILLDDLIAGFYAFICLKTLIFVV